LPAHASIGVASTTWCARIALLCKACAEGVAQGFVANDVETEQIVSDVMTTPLHIRRNGSYKVNPRYTSFVQVRGSIPLSWTQDTSGLAAKPPIERVCTSLGALCWF
jgi:hypothetical protein